MAKRTLDIKSAKGSTKSEPLVYKDASDVSDGDQSSGNEDMSDEEAEEEIKEIPLGQKRRHLDQNDDDEEGEAQLDDSVSDSEDNGQSESDGANDLEDDDDELDDKIASSDSGFDDQMSSGQSDLSEVIRKKKK